MLPIMTSVMRVVETISWGWWPRGKSSGLVRVKELSPQIVVAVASRTAHEWHLPLRIIVWCGVFCSALEVFVSAPNIVKSRVLCRLEFLLLLVVGVALNTFTEKYSKTFVRKSCKPSNVDAQPFRRGARQTFQTK